MKQILLLCLIVVLVSTSVAFNAQVRSRTSGSRLRSSLMMEADKDPLLLRAARGEEVERVPVWMMRQAGRHMKVGILFSCFPSGALRAYLKIQMRRHIQFISQVSNRLTNRPPFA